MADLALAPTPVTFHKALEAARDPAHAQQLHALRWRHRLTSLWAPLSVLGLLFVPYMALVQLWPATSAWAQPAMQWAALLLFLVFLALLAWRLADGRERTLRRLRRDLWELEAEVDTLQRRAGGKLSEPALRRLADQATSAEAAALARDPAALEQRTKGLATLTAEHLGAFRRHSGLDFVGGFGKALLVALAIRTVAVEPFRIPSGSMLPTLHIGDQVFVNKFIYGVRIPFTNWVPFVAVRPPARGDVIVFNNPVDESKDFIKRVVGVPGDRIELVDEVLYVNGVAQPRGLLDGAFVVHNQDPLSGQWQDERQVLYRETLDGHAHAVLQAPSHPHAQTREGPFEVPAGHVFVLGDNRDGSADSRYGLGDYGRGVAYVPYGHIKGKAMVIWLALGHGGVGSSLFGGTGLRTDRLFLPVE